MGMTCPQMRTGTQMIARDVPDDELRINFRWSGHTDTDRTAAMPLNTLPDKGFSHFDQIRVVDRSLVYQYLSSRIARPVNFTSVKGITGKTIRLQYRIYPQAVDF